MNEGKSGYFWPLGYKVEAFINHLQLLLGKLFFAGHKNNSLDPQKANAKLGVSTEALEIFLESRNEAARLNGSICPLCVEDLKWGVDRGD